MLPDRQSVVVRFDCSTANVHRNNILDLCFRNEIGVEKILVKSFGYLLICPSTTDGEKLFENIVQDVLKEMKTKSYIPRELRAKHSIIIRRLDSSLFSQSPEELKEEFESGNKWCQIKEIIKFSNIVLELRLLAVNLP